MTDTVAMEPVGSHGHGLKIKSIDGEQRKWQKTSWKNEDIDIKCPITIFIDAAIFVIF